jgi:hypothetical protein
MMIKPVDGGRAVIGVIECPHCGQTHFTAHIECGERQLFCGTGHTEDTENIRVDGYSTVVVVRII